MGQWTQLLVTQLVWAVLRLSAINTNDLTWYFTFLGWLTVHCPALYSDHKKLATTIGSKLYCRASALHWSYILCEVLSIEKRLSYPRLIDPDIYDHTPML